MTEHPSKAFWITILSIFLFCTVLAIGALAYLWRQTDSKLKQQIELNEHLKEQVNVLRKEVAKAEYQTEGNSMDSGKYEPDVVVYTDKEEYKHGEIVWITIKNVSENSIWYMKHSSVPSCCTLYKWENSQWKNMGIPFNVIQLVRPQLDHDSRGFDAEELKSGGIIEKEWNIKFGEWARDYVESGKYRFSFYYGLENDSLRELAFSNSFLIKQD